MAPAQAGPAVTAPQQPAPAAEPIPNLRMGYGIDVTDPANPAVILVLRNAGVAAEFRIGARSIPQLAPMLAQGLMQAYQQAMTAAGPQLVTPNGSGGLILPGQP